MVTASCEADTELWNTATGISPTAQNAHFEREARRMATHTRAT